MARTEDLRKRLYSFYEKNFMKKKAFTVDHFEDEGESRAIIYRIINRYVAGIQVCAFSHI